MFQARRPSSVASAPVAADRVETSDQVADEPQVPAGPVFVLSGMATNAVDGGVEHTAMVHDGKGLHFVKVGDALPGGYTVVATSDTTVTLRDKSGGERTLRLP